MSLEDYYIALEKLKTREATAVGNLTTAMDTNPEEYAKRLKYQKETGTPLTLMDDPAVRDSAAKEAQAKQFDLTGHPGISEFASIPENAPIITDDVPNLKEFENKVKGVRQISDIVRDLGVWAGKGIVGVPQAAVGLADIPSMGYAGKMFQRLGIDFYGTQKILESWHSEPQKAANKAVYDDADGFVETIQAALENPSTIAGTIIESLPSMGAGGAIGRKLLQHMPKALGKLSPGMALRLTGASAEPSGLATILAGAMGEGAVSAGQAAEQIRVESGRDELLSGKQVAGALGAGLGTTLFAVFGGQLAKKWGITDVDMLLTSGKGYSQGARKMVARRFLEGAITEGIFEEAPQSAIEQIAQNYAQDKPLFEGVDKAVVMGAFAGMAMGSGANLHTSLMERKANQQTKAILDTLTSVEATRLFNRSPETFSEFAQRVGEQHGVEAVYLQLDKAIQAARSAGITEEQMPAWFENYGVSANELIIAVDTGGNIQMDFGKVMAGFKLDPAMQALQNEIMVNPEILPASMVKEKAEDEQAHLEHLNEVYNRDQAQKIDQDDIALWEDAILNTPGLRGRVKKEHLMPLITRANALQVLTQTPAIDHLNRMLGPTGLQAMKYKDFEAKRSAGALSPVTMSQGQINTDSPEFKNWFGDSKVADAEGKPVIVYHGTDAKFSNINFKKGSQGLFWFTSDRSSIESGEIGAQGRSRIMELYVKINNPAGWKEYNKYSTDELKARGYDGVILPEKGGSFSGFIFKDPAQVKSVDNRGTWDPDNPNILLQSTGNPAVATLDGTEIGTDINADNAVQIAREYYKNNLQGKSIEREGFGTVRFTGKGWRKLKRGLTTDIQKAILIPAIPDIISNGQYHEKLELYKQRTDDIVAFHFFSGMVDLKGDLVQVGVTVGEDSFGNLFYNLNHDTDALWEKLKTPLLPRLEARGAGSSEKQDSSSLNVSITPAGDDVKILFQGSQHNTPLGALSIQNGQNFVALFESADKSTFLHESAHIFLNDLKYVAENLGAQTAEWEKVKAWLGIGEDGIIGREQHEKFAETFEAYLKNGQAPSLELRNTFRTFKRWLVSIYEAITSKRYGQRDIEVVPEIADVFDRLLATEQEIKLAREQSALIAMLDEKLLNETGFTAAQIQEYKNIVNQAEDSAREKRDKHKMIGRDDRIKEWRKQAISEAEEVPLYAFIDKIKSGIFINRKSIVDAFGEDNIPESSPMFKANGLDINVAIAEHGNQFGYGSAGEFVGDLRSMPPRKQWIQKRIAQLETQHDMQQDTQDAIRTASLRRQLEIESQWLAKMAEKADADYQKRQAEYRERWAAAEAAYKEAVKLGKRDDEIRILESRLIKLRMDKAKAFREYKATPMRQIREWASQMIDTRTMRQIQDVGRMLAESRQHRQKSISLARQGKWAEALDANEKSRMTEGLIEASYRASNKWKKMEGKWKSIAKWTNDNKRVKVGTAFRDQINRLLTQYGIAEREFDPTAPDLYGFVQALMVNDLESCQTSLPDWVGLGFPMDYKKMKWEQLKDLNDVLSYLYGHGREQVEGQKTAKGIKVAQLALDIIQSQRELKGMPQLKSDATRIGRVLQGIQKGYRKFFAHTGILRFIAQRMDGYKNIGNKGRMGYAEQMVQDIIGGQAAANDMWIDVSKKLEPLLKLLTRNAKIKTDDIPWPEKMRHGGMAWNKERVVAACLNMGNGSNLQRLMDGYGIDVQTVKVLAGKLTAEEWQAVQQIWDVVDELWPKVAAVHERINYFRPKKIPAQAITVNTADGEQLTLEGGYYPVMYDRNIDRDIARWNEKDDILASHEAALQVPVAKSGFTKGRAEKVSRPLDLSLSVLGRHFNDTIRYITLAEVIRDADRVFNNGDLVDRNLDTIGKDMQDMIRPALKQTLRPQANELGWFERSRVAMSIYYMGYNAWTAIQNITGVFPAIYQAGFGNYLSGMYHCLKMVSPLKAHKAMLEASSYMRLRESNIERDMKKQLRDFDLAGIEIKGKRYNYDDVKSLGFAGIRLIDGLVSLPAWWGTYNAEMDMHGDTQKAVEAADAAVNKALGSGLAIDGTAIQRHNFFSLLAPFLSFAATQQEVLATQREGWKEGKVNTSEFLYGHLMIWVMPALMSTFLQGALMYGIVGALGGGSDKKKKDWEDYFTDLISYRLMGIPFVRDIYNALLQGFEHKAPITSARMPATEAYKMVQQLSYRVGQLDGQEKTTKAALWAAAEIASVSSGIPASRIYERWHKGTKDIESGSGWWANHFVPQERKKN